MTLLDTLLAATLVITVVIDTLVYNKFKERVRKLESTVHLLLIQRGEPH